jgi:DNA-binding CsgD family transcriptional regulator
MRTRSESAAMLELSRRGWSISRIAAEFDVDPRTVRRYVRAGSWPGYKPRERSSRTLACRGSTNSDIARVLGITEGTVRYHAKRAQSDAVDGRTRQSPMAASVAAAIDHWRGMQVNGVINLAQLHAWLIAEYGYPGSLRSVQRYWARSYPAPWARARRRNADPWEHVAANLSPWLWMHDVMQGLLPNTSINLEVCNTEEIAELLRRVRECRLAGRNKALAVIASRRGISPSIICRFLGVDRQSLRRYVKIFNEGGTAALFSRKVSSSQPRPTSVRSRPYLRFFMNRQPATASTEQLGGWKTSFECFGLKILLYTLKSSGKLRSQLGTVGAKHELS